MKHIDFRFDRRIKFHEMSACRKTFYLDYSIYGGSGAYESWQSDGMLEVENRTRLNYIFSGCLLKWADAKK